MPAIVVPDLRRKLALLRTYPAKRTWPKLGEAFGVPFKTLQFWQDGDDTRDPDQMPGWAVDILVKLIGEILPGNRSAEDVRKLALGPAADLEDELSADPAGSLLALIESEASRDTATLIPQGPEIELVEVTIAAEPAGHRVRLGEYFRIAFRRRVRAGRVIVLQHAQQAWVVLPAAPSASGPPLLLVPGLDEDGEPSFMVERRDLGRHLFVCFETVRPLPALLRRLARDEVAADRRALGVLTAFYAAQPKPKRACHMLAVECVRAEVG